MTIEKCIKILSITKLSLTGKTVYFSLKCNQLSVFRNPYLCVVINQLFECLQPYLYFMFDVRQIRTLKFGQ